MTKSVTLSNSRTWGSKKDALAHFKSMLAEYFPGDRISDQSHHQDLIALLMRYDKSAAGRSKIGSGIDHFSKNRISKDGWTTECFFVHRVDGTTDDFSYIDAINREPPP